MHFIAEACYRRPLEPKGLAYSRGGTAITMGLLFLAFCGYLISQIYNDQPLIQMSTEKISDATDTPDIELCVEQSSMTMSKCTAMWYDWTTTDIPDCWQRFFRSGGDDGSPRCYIFETNNSYTMAATAGSDNQEAIRRLDFYWNIDSLSNATDASNSIPAIAVQLYDPSFSPWKKSTVGDTPVEQQTLENIRLGSNRATTIFNYTSSITYYVQKYRTIRPRDPASVLGIKPDYIDIKTLINFQHDWPLQVDPPGVNKSLYQGAFSVQLGESTISVKTEVRQHSVLAAVALAGGCYGVLTTIYILLFGMTRLTPWGLVHHIPVFISKRKHHVKDEMYIEEEGSRASHNRDHNNNNGEEVVAKDKKKGFSSTVLVPWFFRSQIKGDKVYTNNGNNDSLFRSMIAGKENEDKQQQHRMEILTNTNSMEHHRNSWQQLYSPEIRLLNSRDQQRVSLSTDSSNDNSINEHLSLGDLSSPKPQQFFNPLPPLETLPHHTDHIDKAGSSRPPEPLTNNPSEYQLQIISNLLYQEQQRSNILEERSTELSNRVEELEVILSEYFINTNYLDQLRSRKHARLVASDSESDNHPTEDTVKKHNQ